MARPIDVDPFRTALFFVVPAAQERLVIQDDYGTRGMMIAVPACVAVIDVNHRARGVCDQDVEVIVRKTQTVRAVHVEVVEGTAGEPGGSVAGDRGDRPAADDIEGGELLEDDARLRPEEFLPIVSIWTMSPGALASLPGCLAGF